MTMTGEPGLQSRLDVESQPVIPGTSRMGSAATWSWIWFIVAILVVIGFHVRVFGQVVPPSPGR